MTLPMLMPLIFKTVFSPLLEKFQTPLLSKGHYDIATQRVNSITFLSSLYCRSLIISTNIVNIDCETFRNYYAADKKTLLKLSKLGGLSRDDVVLRTTLVKYIN